MAAQTALREVVRREPRAFDRAQTRWTLGAIQAVCDWLRLRTAGGLSQLRARLHLSWQRARNYVHSPDPDYDAKRAFIAALVAQGQAGTTVTLYLDELTYYRQPSLAQAWEVQGAAQPRAYRSHRSNTATRVVGTLEVRDGRVVAYQGARVGPQELVAFYQQLHAAYPTAPRLYVIQDNWPWHFHPDVQVALEPQEQRWPWYRPPRWATEPSAAAQRRWGHLQWPIQLVPLPTYASWLNPIEGVWNDLKYVERRNRCCADLAELRLELGLAVKRSRHKRPVRRAASPSAGTSTWPSPPRRLCRRPPPTAAASTAGCRLDDVYTLTLSSVLHSALATAVKWGLIARDPADLGEPPKLRKAVKRALDTEPARKLLRAARGDPRAALCVLALTTGMRIGELMAQRWDEVDLDAGVLTVQRKLLHLGKQLNEGMPKSAAGQRRVELHRLAVDAPHRHRARQLEQRLAAGGEWERPDLVFTTDRGKPQRATIITSYYLPRLLSRAGLPKTTFHELRHSMITLMLSRGESINVGSEMVGHSNVAMTLGVYRHVLPNEQRAAVERLGDVLAGDDSLAADLTANGAQDN